MNWLIPYVQMAFEVYSWLVVIRVFLSWIPHNPYAPVFRFIYEVTEPAMAPFRKLLGRFIFLGMDFSPILVIFALRIIETLVLNLLRAI